MTYLFDLFSCIRIGLPQGGIKFRIRSIFWIITASLKYLGNPKNKIRKISGANKSAVGTSWQQYQAWLNFTYKYISIKDFISCPAISSVSAPSASNKTKSSYSPNMINDINVIRVAYNLSQVFDNPNINGWTSYISIYAGIWDLISKSIKLSPMENIVELGAGSIAGNLIYLSRIYPDVELYNFDLPEMLRIQKLSQIGYSSLENSELRIKQFSEISELKRSLDEKRYCIVSNWAYTEMPMSLRFDFFELFSNASFIAITSNSSFEGVDNYKFLKDLSAKLNFNHFDLPLPLDNQMEYQKKHKLHILYRHQNEE